MSREKILVLGGLGYCGWPTSLFLSKDNDVIIIDDESTPLSTSLTKIDSKSRKGQTNLEIIKMDLSESFNETHILIQDIDPDIVIDFAKQRSAPLSMKSSIESCETLRKNTASTNNLCLSLVKLSKKPLVIHLGTMGSHGYNDSLSAMTEKDFAVHGKNAGSVYHLSKLYNQLSYQFFSQLYGLNVAILNQGIIWGLQPPFMFDDSLPTNRFDFDNKRGTVINRFLTSALFKKPITVHGSGGQKRAFLHINDMIKFIDIILKQRPTGLSYVNQAIEAKTVIEIAQIFSKEFDLKIDHITNPRLENESNRLSFYSKYIQQIKNPTLITSRNLRDEISILKKMDLAFNENCQEDAIKWSNLMSN